ncbi:MAG: endonuclease domain-containing protein [Elusimicrobia bacterium]|nr:endonuclease domain-containing protein [Elusimicrobiota bacterium]
MGRASPDRPWLRIQARRLRREQTDAEKRLWSLLRSRRLSGYKFRRQLILGPFIADFCCVEKRLIVELDGGQHAERTESDSQRTSDLEARGFRVLRFWNMDVYDHAEIILNKVEEALSPPHRHFVPPLPPASRGERD